VSTIKSSAENLTLNADGSGNDIILQSNGSTKVTVDGQNSRVGIGTTSPTDVLELDGTNPILKIGNRIRIKADESNATAWFGIGSTLNTTKIGSADFSDPKLTIQHGSNNDVIVHDGDLWFETAGKGIVLGATSNVDANTLDDYEEGTYQPTLTGSTSGSFNTAAYTYLAYTKIGRVVHIQGYLNIGSESSCVGNIVMSLPFTCSSSLSSDSENAAMTVSLRDHGGSGLDNITGTVAVAGMKFVSLNGSGADNTLDASDIDTAWNIRIGGSYIAA